METLIDTAIFRRKLAAALCAAGCLFGTWLPAEELPAEELRAEESSRLVSEIDRIIAESNVGPMAAICSDDDFVRRVYLDLWGLIPSDEDTLVFLQDSAVGKRVALVQRLIDAPQFARHMTYVFNSMLLERRPDKGIAGTEWMEYLYQSFLRHKPCDQLMREILVADGAQGPDRARAKFLLDRDCDPAGLVRDVGRIYFGKDLQCAQCHDHPSIKDYKQEDYYGLYAFLQRTFLFTDIKNNSTLYVGEKADGLPEYHSVFKPKELNRLAIPRVPGCLPVVPPMSEPGEEFVVAPADDVRPIPRITTCTARAAMGCSASPISINCHRPAL